MLGRLPGTDGAVGQVGTMFYDCLFLAACQREYPPAQLQALCPPPPHPSEDREAGTVEREGAFGRRPVRPSGRLL